MTTREPTTDTRREGPEAPWLTPGRLASLVAVLATAYAALAILRALRPLLLMLLVSVFLSFAMEPAVQFLARRGWRRGPATGLVFAVVAICLAGFFAAMAPLLVAQVEDLIRNIPDIINRLSDYVAQAPLPFDLETSPDARSELAELTTQWQEGLQGAAFGAAGRVVDVGATALSAILQAFTVILVTFYLVADGPRARRVLFRPFPPARQREMLAIWELAVAKTGGYIYSRMLLAFISALATGIFLVITQVPSAIPLAAWVGVTSAFVPVIGTYLGGILPVIVAVASPRPHVALWILGFIVVYQQLENYLLAPKIQSHTMEVHPAVAFVSVLAGGYLLGAVGALLALPAAAIIQALLSTYVARHDLIHELHDLDLIGNATTSSDRRPPEEERRTGTVPRWRELLNARRDAAAVSDAEPRPGKGSRRRAESDETSEHV